MRALIGLVAVIAMLIPARAGAEKAPKNAEPFSRYKMVMVGGVVNATLPFDVPFIIWGDVTPVRADVDSFVSLYMVEADGDSLDCSTIGIERFQRVSRMKTRKWASIDYTDRGETAPSDLAASTRQQYEFLLTALRPSHIYCMLFELEPGRDLTSQERVLLRSRMKPAYREFLNAFGSAGEVPKDQVEGLRLALIRYLLSTSRLEGFRPTEGSVFDPGTTGGPTYNAFLKLAAGVLQPHRTVLENVDILNATQQSAADDHKRNVSELSAWSQRPEVRALEKSPTQTVRDAAIYFGSLDSRGRSNVLLGMPLGGPGPDAMAPLWEVATDMPPAGPGGIFPANAACPTTAQLAGRCANLDTARQHAIALATVLPALPDINNTVAALTNRKRIVLGLQADVNARDVEIERQIESLDGSVREQIRFVTTTIGNVETRRTWYLSVDLGLGVAPTIGEVFPYTGLNIYFRPVNKEAPPGPFLSRFSALVGFTWTDNLVKPGERKALYGDKRMLVLGAGVRATEIFRINGGVLMLKGIDPNPLIEKTRIEVTPFFSISADIDVAGLFGAMFGKDATPPAGLVPGAIQ